MTNADQTTMNQVASEWLTARDVIATALLQMIVPMPIAGLPHRQTIAAAILARLAHAGILIQSQADAERQEKVRAGLLAALVRQREWVEMFYQWCRNKAVDVDALDSAVEQMNKEIAAAIAAAETTPCA